MRDAAAGDGIQFVAPRTDLFASSHFTMSGDEPAPGDGAAPFMDGDGDDERPARWTTALAGLGVVALIAVGVIAAAPWRDDPDDPADAAPTTTVERATTTTTATNESTESGVLAASGIGDEAVAAAGAGGPPVGYLLEPTLLSDVEVVYADAPSVDLRLTMQPRGWLDVWTTAGATAQLGAWLSVETSPWGGIDGGADAQRVAVGDEVGVLTADAAWASLQLVLDEWRSVSITARGWTPDALISFAAGISLVNGRPVYAAPPGSGYSLVVSRLSSGWGITNELRAQTVSGVQYATPDGHLIEVTTRPADDDEDRALLTLLLAPVPGQAVSGPGSFIVHDGRALTIGTDPVDGWGTQVLFTEHGSTISISGDVEVATLVELAERARLRPGSRIEWNDMVFDILLQQGGVFDGSGDGAGRESEEVVASAALPDGAAWSAYTPTGSDRSTSTVPMDVVPPAPVGEAATAIRSYPTVGQVPVVLVLPNGIAVTVAASTTSGATTLRVRGTDGTIASTELVPATIGIGADVLVAGLWADVLGPYVVEMLDASGTVLTSVGAGDVDPAPET